MSGESNKTYRIRTDVNKDTFVGVDVNLCQDYDTFSILSMSISDTDTYRLHNANYGIIVGRVLANDGFGVPNAKVSVFVEADLDDEELSEIYGYKTVASTDSNDIRYNLLPDSKVSSCYQVVGTFPSKTYMLNNDVLLEVYEKYYKLTAKTNGSGDYMLCGVPTGNTILHMDLDLSDCGILSQKPRDFVYKGYNINQFDSPTKFKQSTTLESLPQIISQNTNVFVQPLWGNASLGATLGITRADINVNYKFEPTCVFIGGTMSDNPSNGISKNCVPTDEMGAMDELTTGKGTIEMIRKTPGGEIEEFIIKGNDLINGNGVWCYQIPMNLDYIMTNEYGDIVPTDDPSKGIPTRTSVRFRFSLNDLGTDDTYFRGKILVPNNPQVNKKPLKTNSDTLYDYNFGTFTKEESFRDLLWNNVYSVKQYIPRFSLSKNPKSDRFTGIKHCNIYGDNNPMPYNNIRIKLPLMFRLLCALVNSYIRIVTVVNNIIRVLALCFARLSRIGALTNRTQSKLGGAALSLKYLTIADGLCPDLENWYFAPNKRGNLIEQVFSGEASGRHDGPNWTGDSDESVSVGGLYFNTSTSNTGGKGMKMTIVSPYAKYFVCFTKPQCEKYDKTTYKNLVDYDSSRACYRIGTVPTSSTKEQWVKLGDEEFVRVYFKQCGAENYRTNDVIKKEKVTIVFESTDGTIREEDEFYIWYNDTKFESAVLNQNAKTWWDFAKDDLKQYIDGDPYVNLYNQTIYYLSNRDEEAKDSKSIDSTNRDDEMSGMCVTNNTDYLLYCIEMNLAQEYRVINFDFYNDWINGSLYFPRWGAYYKPKRRYFKHGKVYEEKIKGCMADGPTRYKRHRNLVQQCAIGYSITEPVNGTYTKIVTSFGCGTTKRQKCHKKAGLSSVEIFGANGGVIKQSKTMKSENVFYYKPCEWKTYDGKKVNLFATDIILLGSLNDCSTYGIPQAFSDLASTSYKMPTNIALTNMDSNGALFATDNGTYCIGGSDNNGLSDMASGVTPVSNSYSSIAQYYSSLSGTDEYIGVERDSVFDGDGDLINDVVAVTEAAGIAWNYTGPGQGLKTDEYQPGGHFLGISCNVPETNIKSCVNLQRICELGSGLSQRRIKVRAISDSGDTKYSYFVPTGLISNEDVVNPSFRTMFATMNMKPLVCDTIDPDTGYKKYSFVYEKSDGYDGSLTRLTSKTYNSQGHETANPYNKKLTVQPSNSVIDINELYQRDVDFINSYAPLSTSAEFWDAEELQNTYRKTVERTNTNYYMFRLGLSDLSNISALRSKYLLQNSEQVKMPQYENSFYFYFGLKEGSTALDEFNEQFFSNCDFNEDNSDPYMVVTKTSDECSLKGSFTASLFNIDGEGAYILEGENEAYSGTMVSNTLSVNELDLGEYKLTVVVDGVTLTSNITFDEPKVFVSYVLEHINFKVEGTDLVQASPRNVCDKISLRGKITNSGYIDIDRTIELNYENYDILSDSGSCCVIINNRNNGFWLTTSDTLAERAAEKYGLNLELASKLPIGNFADVTDDSVKVYLWRPECVYDVYVVSECSDSDVSCILYDTFTLHGIDTINMYLGSKFLSYCKNYNSEGFSLEDLNPGDEWWKNIDKTESLTNWALRHYLTNQSDNTATTFDSNVFLINRNGVVCNDGILFGQPENSTGLYLSDSGLAGSYVFSSKEQNKYYGYALNDTGIRHGTWGKLSDLGTPKRAMFGKMQITDNEILSEAIDSIQFTSVETVSGVSILSYTTASGDFPEKLLNRHGCLVKYGTNVIYPAYVSGSSIMIRDNIQANQLPSLKVHPLFYYPVMVRPFYAQVDYIFYNTEGNNSEECLVNEEAFGTIYNGITYNREFGRRSNLFTKFGMFSRLTGLSATTSDYVNENVYRYTYVGSGRYFSANTMFHSVDMTEEGNTGHGFFIEEGSPISIDSDMDIPEMFSKEYAKCENDAIMYDVITAKKNGSKYIFSNKKRNSNYPDENGKSIYIAVTSTSVNMPYQANGDFYNAWSRNGEYYYRLISNIIEHGIAVDGFEVIVPDGRTTYSLDGTPRCVIGFSEATNGNNRARVFKFYKNLD